MFTTKGVGATTSPQGDPQQTAQRAQRDKWVLVVVVVSNGVAQPERKGPRRSKELETVTDILNWTDMYYMILYVILCTYFLT